MKYSLNLLLLSCLLFFSGCLDEDSGIIATITTKNNTRDTIGYYRSFSKNINDSLLPENKPNFKVDYDNWGILPFSSKTEDIRGNNFPDLQQFMDQYVLFYYFFNYDSIKTLPWSKIREKNIYMKRIIIDTKQDLENCNFTIAYP
jgi:hypothetical protein